VFTYTIGANKSEAIKITICVPIQNHIIAILTTIIGEILIIIHLIGSNKFLILEFNQAITPNIKPINHQSIILTIALFAVIQTASQNVDLPNISIKVENV